MLFLNHSNDYHCQKVGFKSADLSADIWLDNDQIIFWLVSFPRHFTRKCQTFSKYAFYTKSKLDHCHFSANFYFWSLCYIVTISSQFFVSILCLCITPVSLGAAVCHKCKNLSHFGHGGGRSQDSCNTAVELYYLIGLSEPLLWSVHWVLGFNNNYKTFQLSFF